MLDIHTHILPYVDDGSTSMQMTHEMLKEARAAGIDRIVATPHFRDLGIGREKILQIFAEVRSAAEQYGIRMLLGYEVHVSMLAHLQMPSVADWCVQGTKTILLEFSDTTRPLNWDVTVCELIRGGYQPVVVHPERYVYIQKSTDMAFELKRYGCELQVDAMAFENRLSFGNPGTNAAKRLLKSGIVDYIASDAHRPEHYRQFRQVRKRLGRQWPDQGVLNQLVHP